MFKNVQVVLFVIFVLGFLNIGVENFTYAYIKNLKPERFCFPQSFKINQLRKAIDHKTEKKKGCRNRRKQL